MELTIPKSQIEVLNQLVDDEHGTIPKLQIEVLSQLVDDEQGVYRVRAGDPVHYLKIHGSTFDEDTMCRLYPLIPQLPAFPDGSWSKMHLSRGTNGASESKITHEPLRAIRNSWHPCSIDVLSLKHVKRHKSNVHEVHTRVVRI
jgi:hypothetical protein